MTPLLLRARSHYLRLTTHWPSIGTIVPFIPLIVAWWIVSELQVFPRAFLPGPVEVVRSFGSLVYTGILPEYLQDSIGRLAVGSFWGIALGRLGKWPDAIKAHEAALEQEKVRLAMQARPDFRDLALYRRRLGRAYEAGGKSDAARKELDEAALIDGANHLQMLTKIFIPVALPGIIAATIFAFTVSWAAFVYPIAFLFSADQQVLTVGTVTSLIKADVYKWGMLMAGALVAAAPPLIVYAFLMDYYIAGLTAGATKG